MTTYTCGGKPNTENQNIWKKISRAVQTAKEKASDKAVELAGTKAGLAAISVVSGMTTVGFDKLREFSFSLPDTNYFAGAVGMTAGAGEAAAAAATLVTSAMLAHELGETKLGKAFVNGVKNTSAKMETATRTKLVPFAKKAMVKCQENFGNSNQHGPFMNVYEGKEYRGTVINGAEGSKIVKQPMNVLKSWWNNKVRGGK